MDEVHQLIAFTGVATILTVTPGLDTALVLRTSTVNGARAGIGAAGGIVIGCLLWGIAVAMGLSAVLTASMAAFTLLRWIGAAYLMWLGVGLLRAPRQRLAEAGGSLKAVPAPARVWWRRGLLTNLLNPKVGVFYIALLPQFVPASVAPESWMILLAAIHAMLGLCWFAVLIAAAQPLGQWLRRPAVLSTIDRLTGILFLGFGARLVFERR